MSIRHTSKERLNRFNMGSSLTIKEIAKQANVSIGTVDRVLHNRGRVAESTKEKILKIAKEGNYSSNILARNLKLNKTFKIQVILPNDNSYALMLKAGMDIGQEEYESMGFSTNYFFQNEPVENAREILEDLFKDDSDAFIIAPSLFHQYKELLENLRASKKPFVFVDSRINESPYISYIGQDAYKSGALAAKLLFDKYTDQYEVFIVTFSASELSEQTVVKRVKGFESFFAEKEKTHMPIHKINLESDQIDQEELLIKLGSINHPVHLFIPNSKTYLLSNVIQKINKSGQIKVVGYDLLAENKELLENESIDYLIHQKPKEQGYLAMQTLYKHLVLGQKFPREQFMSLDIITKENLAYV